MSNKPILIIAVVGGGVFVASSLLFAPVVGIIVAILIVGAGLVLQRALDKPEKFAQQLGQADVLNRMWFPLQDELTEVVRSEGRVTEASSAWTSAPGLSKRETPSTFYSSMQWYVRQRGLVASLAASDLSTEASRQELVSEQWRLLSKAQELLDRVNKSIDAIPGAATAVRRTRRSQPRPAAQRPLPASARPSAGTRQPAPVSRSIQAQRIMDTPTTPSAPRPAATPLRITDTPTPPSAPPPPRITYTPMPSPPTVVPSPRLEPEPPPTPPVSTPVVASSPEPIAPPRPPEPSVATPAPEPVVVAPAPIISEPPAQPSEPPADLKLDVASVCEDLFNPKMMSYEANRLFDDRYKDATVRWTGTARRASAYSYDFNFGDGGGTKVEFDVYEVKQQYGSRTVKAFVQLPQEAAADLGPRIGESIEFEGRLMTCEGSARRIYVADARMVD